MKIDVSKFEVKLAETPEEVAAAQRLRYRVFVEEMGAPADEADHVLRLEKDSFDPFFEHMILIDKLTRSPDPLDRVVGVYRLMTDEAAAKGQGYYGAGEYDLSAIIGCGRRALELGRSCVAAEHRTGLGLHVLWNGLAAYVARNGIEVLFGVASFHGTDPAAIAPALANLHYNHLAPPELRVQALANNRVEMDLLPPDTLDTKDAMRLTPSLIKAYLRLGGFVGEGAWIDHDFNTIDVCLVMDTERMGRRYHDYFNRNAQLTG